MGRPMKAPVITVRIRAEDVRRLKGLKKTKESYPDAFARVLDGHLLNNPKDMARMNRFLVGEYNAKKEARKEGPKKS